VPHCPQLALNWTPLNPRAGDQVLFDASASNDSAGLPLTYTLMINNTQIGSGPNPLFTYTFSQSGLFRVDLIVGNGYCAPDLLAHIMVLGGFNVTQSPIAYDQNVSTNQNTPLSITLFASDPNNNLLTYFLVSQPSHGILTGFVPNLVYTPASNYVGRDSFQFKVNNGFNDSNIATVSINVLPIAQSGDVFLNGPFTTYLNVPITVIATSNLSLVSYTWDFGDGTGYTTTTNNASHAYGVVGIYTITLLATDSIGGLHLATTTARAIEKTTPPIIPQTNPVGHIRVLDIEGYGSGRMELERAQVGDDLIIKGTFINDGDRKLEDVHMSVIIPDWGIKQTTGSFEMSRNVETTQTLDIPLDGVQPGFYIIEVDVGNGDARANGYVFLTVTA